MYQLLLRYAFTVCNIACKNFICIRPYIIYIELLTSIYRFLDPSSRPPETNQTFVNTRTSPDILIQCSKILYRFTLRKLKILNSQSSPFKAYNSSRPKKTRRKLNLELSHRSKLPLQTHSESVPLNNECKSSDPMIYCNNISRAGLAGR